MDKVRATNRLMFLFSVMITGAVAGAFVWLLLFLMNLGISFIWDRVPVYLGQFYPIVMCVIGGAVIGLFVKRFGPYPESLQTVMAKVKRNGRYDYKDLAPMSAGALLPLVFGGSVGPEAGLTGVIAAICTWVSDRLKRFGSDFKELSEVGMYAAISAIFTAPLFGFAGAMSGERTTGGYEVTLTKFERVVVYIVAISGAVLTMLLLSHHVGGGLSLPRYSEIVYGTEEFLWLIPMALVGGLAGWLFCVLDVYFERIASFFDERSLIKPVLGGLLLGICGICLPFTMFAGEIQAEELNEVWMTMSVSILLLTGFAKIFITALCVNMGWRGGHFFPVIFSGISIGYGMSMALGVDPVFSVCAVTAAVVGGVMRKPLLAILMLFLCFPFHSVLILAIAAVIGAYLPLPDFVKRESHPNMGTVEETVFEP